MSKKRYNSGSSRGGSYQGNKKSTSTQQSSHEDSLVAECLIRTFMEKGDKEDPVLKTLFIGGSKPKADETEADLLFRRLRNCWMERDKNYGMKEYLKGKMKECGLEVDTDNKWAKYSIMGAPLIISPKIWVNRTGEEKKFLKDFQLDIFRDDKYLSECAARIQKYGYIKTIEEAIPYRIVIHQWDQFPDRNPIVLENKKSQNQKRSFHFLMDDHEILHHINLYNHQIQLLDCFYRSNTSQKLQLIQQDWSEYICAVRGKKKIIKTTQRKSTSRERQQDIQINPILQSLREQSQSIQQNQLVEETIMSDQDSQRSRGKEKEKSLKGAETPEFVLSRMGRNAISEIAGIERTLLLASQVDTTDKDIIPIEIFPQGITGFAEKEGVGNFLCLFLKLNYEYLTSPIPKTRERYFRERDFEIDRLKKEIISDLGAKKGERPDTTYYHVINDAIYMGSDIIIYSDMFYPEKYTMAEFIMLEKGDRVRYFYMFQNPLQEMKYILQTMNKLLKAVGFARISIDPLIICPLCAWAADKQAMFRHSCKVSVDLTKMRGRRQ